VLVGDFEPAAALREIERLYGKIPRGEPLPEVATASRRRRASGAR
jgi:predicted Zn-dependent peptidase